MKKLESILDNTWTGFALAFVAFFVTWAAYALLAALILGVMWLFGGPLPSREIILKATAFCAGITVVLFLCWTFGEWIGVSRPER